MRIAILIQNTVTVSFTDIYTWLTLKWVVSSKQSSISLLLELSLEINFLAIDIISLTPTARK